MESYKGYLTLLRCTITGHIIYCLLCGSYYAYISCHCRLSTMSGVHFILPALGIRHNSFCKYSLKVHTSARSWARHCRIELSTRWIPSWTYRDHYLPIWLFLYSLVVCVKCWTSVWDPWKLSSEKRGTTYTYK